jgi:hypothetical protein
VIFKEFVMTPFNFPFEVGRSTSLVFKDPGNTGVLNEIPSSFRCLELNPAAAGETRFLPVPSKTGLFLSLTYGQGATAGGTAKVAIGSTGSAPTTTIDGTNKYATISGYGQLVLLYSVPAGATTFQWALLANQGAALSAA